VVIFFKFQSPEEARAYARHYVQRADGAGLRPRPAGDPMIARDRHYDDNGMGKVKT